MSIVFVVDRLTKCSSNLIAIGEVHFCGKWRLESDEIEKMSFDREMKASKMTSPVLLVVEM